jgi:hypothetical protein
MTPDVDHERAIAIYREAEHLARKRQRAEKEARALARAAMRRSAQGHDASGRRRTSVRAAGIVVMSAIAGLRTSSIAIRRRPGCGDDELWSADVKFDIEKGHTHYMNDPGTPAEIDAIHAMRALAPGIAERLFLRVARTGAVDQNNVNTARRLAMSYMHKTQETSSIGDPEKQSFCAAIFDDFYRTATLHLKEAESELARMADLLMRKTKISRSECEAILGAVYARFEARCANGQKLQLFRPPIANVDARNIGALM